MIATDRDWPLEEGPRNYTGRCRLCGMSFFGQKNRIIMKTCHKCARAEAQPEPLAEDPATPSETPCHCDACGHNWTGPIANDPDVTPCPQCQSLAVVENSHRPTSLEATPRTMRCWRDGGWQTDELANLSNKLERENAALSARIADLVVSWNDEHKEAVKARIERDTALARIAELEREIDRLQRLR